MTPPVVPDFTIIERLSARSGATEVWAARAPDGRLVALKLLRTPPDASPDLAIRFEAEGALLSRLGGQHHLIRCEAVIAWPPCLVLELATQGNLRDLLEADGPLHPRVAVGLIRQVADALGWLHQNQVIHRDVKPSNLVAQDDGTWRLVDLGVAAHGTPPRGMPPGWIEEEVGTLGYAAPELLADPQAATEAIDVFGLGVTLFEAVTGELPAATVTPTRLGSVPAALAGALARAIDPDPTTRFASIGRFAAALAQTGY